MGLGIALLLNSLDGVTSAPVGIRTVTDRPAVDSPRAQLSAAAAADRVHDRQGALRHRRAAKKRAAALKVAAANARFKATSQDPDHRFADLYAADRHPADLYAAIAAATTRSEPISRSKAEPQAGRRRRRWRRLAVRRLRLSRLRAARFPDGKSSSLVFLSKNGMRTCVTVLVPTGDPSDPWRPSL